VTRFPPASLLPIGAAAPVDRSGAFAEVFCSVLAESRRRGASWGACSEYLEPAGAERELRPLRTTHRVAVIPGIFGRCIADEVQTFSDAREHLESLGVRTDYLDVSGLGGTGYNGRMIVEQIHRKIVEEPGATFILVGYSKGAPDAMEALVMDAEIRRHVAALVTVAGAVGGSRLADGTTDSIRALVGNLAPEKCGEGDKKGIESLKREERLTFLQGHPGPLVPTYSLVATSSREQTSRVHQGSWSLLGAFETGQDGQMIAYEAIAPGAAYLGAAQADHWAVALPFENAHAAWKLLVDRNHFPRKELLEAIIRFIVDDLGTSESQ